jgi:hypothetical protein
MISVEEMYILGKAAVGTPATLTLRSQLLTADTRGWEDLFLHVPAPGPSAVHPRTILLPAPLTQP